jgi:hypothetical protein
MPLILGWVMPMSQIGGSKRDMLAIAMTDDGEMLLQSIIANAPSSPSLEGLLFQFLDSDRAHARFSRRFPEGYEAESTTMHDPRVRKAVHENRKLGNEGDLRL